MAEPYIGEIMMFAGNFAPQGWALCDGSVLSIAQNTALFAILGTTYGGNGQTTFALPDLRGRAPVHPGQGPGLSPYALGQNGGVEQVSLTTAQMPAHTHLATATVTINVNDSRADATSPNGAVLSQPEAASYAAEPDGTSTMNARAVTAAVTVGLAGNSAPVPTLSPYLCVNFIIALQGIFPSRP
jgi:microcystin-dependent protein